jgi:putative PIN family toxin of toxin-antitoxin system
MPRLFIDASVFFAAAYSTTGYARDLLMAAIDNKVTLVVNSTVLEEVERNLQKKAPDKLQAFRLLLSVLPIERLSEIDEELLAKVSEYVVAKDVPIVAGALAAKVDYLVTYDEKDLLKPTQIAEKSGLKIVRPDAVINLL